MGLELAEFLLTVLRSVALASEILVVFGHKLAGGGWGVRLRRRLRRWVGCHAREWHSVRILRRDLLRTHSCATVRARNNDGQSTVDLIIIDGDRNNNSTPEF